ncbi:MAG: DUF4163 domain-containing protein [Phascolarctobacterium sp.]|nr:DUF4163 domain-containing protein [Phascolarctobacterium sp.]
MKKILAALCVGLTFCASAFATEVTTMQYKTDKTDYKYPRFTLEDANATKKINKTVTNEFKSLLKAHQKDHNLVGGGMNYKVELDNDKYLCFNLEPYDYYGGAHGMYYTEYFVFDKATGKRLAYTEFVPSINSGELQWGIKNKFLPVYLVDGSTSDAPFLNQETLVTDNFRLNEDGTVDLVYAPYALDCYAAGNTFVRLEAKQIEKLKVMIPAQ